MFEDVNADEVFTIKIKVQPIIMALFGALMELTKQHELVGAPINGQFSNKWEGIEKFTNFIKRN